MKTTANKVKAAAKMLLETDSALGFGGRQVYISALLDNAPALGLTKAALVEMAARGELELVRGDLVGVMDAAQLAASETRRGETTYHFVVAE